MVIDNPLTQINWSVLVNELGIDNPYDFEYIKQRLNSGNLSAEPGLMYFTKEGGINPKFLAQITRL